MNWLAQVDRVPTWHEKSTFTSLKDAYNSEANDRVLIFVGSGLSIGMGLPTWKGLLLQLTDVAKAQGLAAVEDAALRAEIDSGSDLPGVASKVKKAMRAPAAWRQSLNELLDPESVRSAPSRVHDALIALRCNRFVTTNYDGLLEDALDRASMAHNVVDSLDGFGTAISTDSYVMKIHGNVRNPDSSVVLAREDYDRLYADRDGKQSVFHERLKSVLVGQPLTLFVGYGQADPYLHKVLSAVRDLNPEAQRFALVPRATALDTSSPMARAGEETGLAFVEYDAAQTHRELYWLLEYLSSQEDGDRHFVAVQRKRRPTAVLLHTGGTIGSEGEDGSLGRRATMDVPSRYTSSLKRMTRASLSQLAEFYDAGNEPQVDVLWEVMAPESQLLSENANVETWNDIARSIDDVIYKYFRGRELIKEGVIADARLRAIYAKECREYRDSSFFDGEDLTEGEFIAEIRQRYILGVVVMHGTDTLDFTAAALTLALTNLPCSIIITGANQPPNLDDPLDQHPRHTQTDAQRNVARCLHFLACAAHVYSELFVCFGNYVHFGLNLRKTEARLLSGRASVHANRGVEQFAFRNHSSKRRYAFKLVDGVYCNNLYPIELRSRSGRQSRHLHYDSMCDPQLNKAYRHLRPDPLHSPPRDMQVKVFRDVVVHLRATPAFPDVSISHLLNRRESELRVVVIDCYNSGTFESSGGAFTRFVLGLAKRGIPVIIVAPFGVMPEGGTYENSLPDDVLPTPLFGVVAETAVPLVALVAGGIGAEWGDNPTHDVPQAIGRGVCSRRRTLLRERINAWLTNACSIPAEDLADITKPGLGRRGGIMREVPVRRRISFTEEEVIGLIEKGMAVSPELPAASSSTPVTLSRHDFHWLHVALLHSHEALGARPDGAAELLDRGVVWGRDLFTTMRSKLRKVQEPRPFADLSAAQRAGRVEAAQNAAIAVAGLLHEANVATVVFENLKVIERDSSTMGFSLDVRASSDTSNEPAVRVCSLLDRDRDYFDGLMAGDAGGDISRFLDIRAKLWSNRMGALDWLIFGVAKGVACAIAQYLHFARVFDLMNDDSASLKEMRERISASIVSSGEYLTLHLEYVASNAMKAMAPSHDRKPDLSAEGAGEQA